jgi:hypothetical protein
MPHALMKRASEKLGLLSAQTRAMRPASRADAGDASGQPGDCLGGGKIVVGAGAGVFGADFRGKGFEVFACHGIGLVEVRN